MRVIQAPTRAVRSQGWPVSPLSVGRTRPGPGPFGRSGGASSPGPVLTTSGGRRCASPRGPAQGCSSARAAPRGALSARARSPAATAPLAGPSCSLSLLLPLARPPARGSQCPGPPGGCEGGRLLRGCTHLQRPRFLAGQCTDPRRLQRAATRTYWPLLLLLRALGVGGGEAGEWRRRQRAAEARMAAQGASAPRNNRSGWRRAVVGTAQSTVHRACELASCSRGGARRALTRPWPLAARRGSRGSASRRLTRAGASLRLASPCLASPRLRPRCRTPDRR